MGASTYLFIQYSCVLAKVISGNAVSWLLFSRFVHDLFGLVIVVAISSFISSWECCTDTMLVLSAVKKMWCWFGTVSYEVIQPTYLAW